MRRLFPLVGLAAIGAASIATMACGPAPEPAAPTTAATAVPPPAPPPPSAPELDLSPVPEPADVIGVARWKSPTGSLSAIASCAGMPPQILDAGAKSGVTEIVRRMLRDAVDTDAFASVVSTDAPVDAVAVLDPSPKKPGVLAAFSIGLTSLERAKQAAEAKAALVELVPGVWKLGAKARRGPTCAIAASAGATPARLVCGDREKDLTALAPYLARTLPTRETLGPDLHAEVRFGPVEARYGGMMRQGLSQLPVLAQTYGLGEPKFDRALVDAASGIQQELVALTRDFDKLTIDVGLGAGACLTGSGTLDLRGTSSWLGGTLVEQAGKAGPPPDIFWRAPKDSESVLFSRGGDPARLTAIRKTLQALAEGALAKAQVGTPADRKAIADLLDVPLAKNVASVQASGHGTPPPPGQKAKPQQVFDGLLDAMIGWSLVGVEDEATAHVKWLKDFVAAYNRAAVQARLKKELGDEAKFLPTVKAVTAPTKLGKGSFAIELAIKDIPLPDSMADGNNKGKKATVRAVAHVLLMPDGKRTWFAIGVNRDELVKRLLSVKADAADAATIATRPGLEPLRTAKLTSGGFLTVASFTRSFGSSLGYLGNIVQGGMPSDAQKLATVLGALPHKGETPILLTSTVTGTSPVRAQLTFSLPKDAVEDVTAALVNASKLR